MLSNNQSKILRYTLILFFITNTHVIANEPFWKQSKSRRLLASGEEIGSVYLPDDADFGICLTSNEQKAYVSCFYKGVCIVDISDKSKPKLVGNIDTEGRVY